MVRVFHGPPKNLLELLSLHATTVGRRRERGCGRSGGSEDWLERFALSGPKQLREPVRTPEAGRVGKPHIDSECLRGDVRLHLRPSEEMAARRRKRRFEAGCGGWVRRKGGVVERAGLNESIARNEASAALLTYYAPSLLSEYIVSER